MRGYKISSTRKSQLNREIKEALGRPADPTILHPHSAISPGIHHVIQGDYGYGHGWEDLTAETSKAEALQRLREYRKNEPGTSFRRVRRQEPVTRKKPSTTKKSKQAHATRPSSQLKSYRNLVQKAITRCAEHPRANHSLYECVFDEVHGGAPFPTPKMRSILENEVHKARPGSSHATKKKKLDPHEAKQLLRAKGINFSDDFHQLPHSQVQLLLDAARAAGYRKRKDAPGSTARMYFQYLSRLR